MGYNSVPLQDLLFPCEKSNKFSEIFKLFRNLLNFQKFSDFFSKFSDIFQIFRNSKNIRNFLKIYNNCLALPDILTDMVYPNSWWICLIYVYISSWLHFQSDIQLLSKFWEIFKILRNWEHFQKLSKFCEIFKIWKNLENCTISL